MRAVCHEFDRPRHTVRRNGAATVEFAITAPIVFLFLFAALEFGSYNMIMQTASNAAFEGARRCIVPGASAVDGRDAGRRILGAVGLKNGTVTISPSTITNTTTQVTATVTIPVGGNLWLTPRFIKTGTITRSCTLTCDWVNSTRRSG